MKNNLTIVNMDNVQSKIFMVRDVQVLLDNDLADLYHVETKQLNRAVKRNKERFPETFCFQLSDEEYRSLNSKFMTFDHASLRFHFDTSNSERGGRRYLAYVFTSLLYHSFFYYILLLVIQYNISRV